MCDIMENIIQMALVMKGAKEYCQMLLDGIVKVESYGQERAKKKMGGTNTGILMHREKEKRYIVGD